MRSHATKRFWSCFASLPPNIQQRARKNFRLWQENQRHPAVRFKQIRPNQPIYSARIGLGWRALGLLEGDTVIWFWIGSHSDYDRLIERD